MYSLHLVFIFEFFWTCHCDLTKYGEPRNSPVKSGLSPTIMKVFIKGNLMGDELEKVLELYSKRVKNQNEVEGGTNPMMDYLEKIYSLRNYDLLRPYRSIFRGFKTLGKHDHTTHSPWLKLLHRGKYANEDYWELKEPIVTKMPDRHLGDMSILDKINKEMKGDHPHPTTSATNSSDKSEKNSSSSSLNKLSQLLSPLEVIGRKDLTTPASLRFCDHPCDNAGQLDEAKTLNSPGTTGTTFFEEQEVATQSKPAAPSTMGPVPTSTSAPILPSVSAPRPSPIEPIPFSTSEPEEEETVDSANDCCDEDDYEDVEVFSNNDSNNVLSIPANKQRKPFGSKTTKQIAMPATTIQTTERTVPPKPLISGTDNSNLWTLPPHPVLDQSENTESIPPRVDGGSVIYVIPASSVATTTSSTVVPTSSTSAPTLPSSAPLLISTVCPNLKTVSESWTSVDRSNKPGLCHIGRKKHQKIIVKISSSLGEVPVVIMRDNKTNGVSLSLVNEFVLDENNNLYKKVKHKNGLVTSRRKVLLNKKFLPEIRVYPKVIKSRNRVVNHSLDPPQPLIQTPLFAPPPPRSFPFQLNPLARVYGFPESRVGPPAFLQSFNLGLRPPLFPLYFGGNLQAPIPSSRQRYELKGQ